MIRFQADTESSLPIYKQLIRQVTMAVKSRKLLPGEHLPSMNELSAELGISKETVKKAYGILCKNGILIPRQGKGFYVAGEDGGKLSILVLFDKRSIYKQILFNSFVEELGDRAEITILTHNQDLDLFTYYLDNALDHYDYYVVTPHFPLDDESQALARRQIRRIPNRKLIITDYRIKSDDGGHFGAVYQDFENDVYDGLMQGLDRLKDCPMLSVIILERSLYGSLIRRGIERFPRDMSVPVRFLKETPEEMFPGETYLIVNSQLDWGLARLAEKISENHLTVGKDVFIISYNESGLDSLILGGLTTMSTDFRQMGREAARMISSKETGSVHCNFTLTRRSTF